MAFAVFSKGIPRTTRIILFLLMTPLLVVMIVQPRNAQNPTPIKPVKPPIPIEHVIVDGVERLIQMQTCCKAEEPCVVVPIQDTYWEFDRNGDLKVMLFEEELHFERGYFEEPSANENPHWSWVPHTSGGYLLARQGSTDVYIIHYPYIVEFESEQQLEESALDTED